MSPTTKSLPAAPRAVAELYAPVAADLQEVETIIRRQLRSDFPFVDELVRYGCLLGGKRLRPALLLLSGQAVGELCREHWTLAAVVEMIHTATLVHDDVLDAAQMRRHLATVNSRWDTEASVLLGDYLFTHAFFLACSVQSNFASQWIGQATNTVCEGELRQKGSQGVFTLSEQEYLGIIEAKTAALYACSCRLGAHFAGGDSQAVEQLDHYGRCLGIAFQIADDLLDVLGDERVAGKSLGTDLQLRKPTLPLIRVLQQAEDGEREELLALLHQGDAEDIAAALAPRLLRHDAIAYTRQRAFAYAQRAAHSLQGLPDTPARRSLEQLCDFVVVRAN